MKPMEPKKAKTAILITAIAAVLILALCLCVLFEVPVFGKKTEPAASPTPVALTAEPTKKPVEPARKPSEADLAGTSEMLQHPDQQLSGQLPPHDYPHPELKRQRQGAHAAQHQTLGV